MSLVNKSPKHLEVSEAELKEFEQHIQQVMLSNNLTKCDLRFDDRADLVLSLDASWNPFLTQDIGLNPQEGRVVLKKGESGLLKKICDAIAHWDLYGVGAENPGGRFFLDRKGALRKGNEAAEEQYYFTWSLPRTINFSSLNR
mgnify:CR=1 FL=1|tara:strand:+ start:111 stop:539 length:429 start_codon:yes stop_codon:yes gene_type:complete